MYILEYKGNFLKKIGQYFVACTLVLLSVMASAEEIRLATDYGTMPYNYLDKDGNPTGFQIDLIKAIGKEEGFTIVFSNALYPQVFDELDTNKIDLIGNLYYSDERNAKYLLSNPYWEEQLVFVALAKKDIKDPLAPGNRVATHEYAPSEQQLLAILPQYPQVKTISEQTSFLDFKALYVNKADVTLSYKTNVNELMNRYNKEKYTLFPVTQEGLDSSTKVYFATRRDKPDLIKKINDGLEKVKANGTFDKLKKKYKLH